MLPTLVVLPGFGQAAPATNSLYGSRDDQLYPDGAGAWMARLDVGTDGGISIDERFSLEGDAFRGRRPHQVRPQGGGASSDSCCYPPD